MLNDAMRDRHLEQTPSGESNIQMSANTAIPDSPAGAGSYPSPLLDALDELAKSIEVVCGPLFTASDGGDMWCSMRHRAGAKKSVKRLKDALASARTLLATRQTLNITQNG
jgi:hypothetical protein